jgi:proteasome lid subunit RPN8/RPN11
LKIRKDQLEAIAAHGREGYPFEVCGVLVGTPSGGGQVGQVIPLPNRETEQPRVRYQMAPEDLLRVQREAGAAGREIIGYYHTHPDHPARPSETDRRIAAEGLSDGVFHMVFGVDQGERVTPSAWVFREAQAGFEPETIETD